MSLSLYQWLAAFNWLLCAGIAWASICRLNSQVCKVNLKQRARYTLLLTGALVSSLQTALFGEWPGISTILFSLAVFCSMVLNMPRRNSTREFT